MVTETDGFFTYNTPAKTTVHYPASRLPGAPVHSIYIDRNSEVWFGQDIAGTVAHFNARTKVLKTEVILVEPTSTDRSRPAFHVHEDIFGSVWVHPYGGGFSRFDKAANCLRPFYNGFSDTDWRFPIKSILLFPTGKAICGCAPIPRDWRKSLSALPFSV